MGRALQPIFLQILRWATVGLCGACVAAAAVQHVGLPMTIGCTPRRTCLAQACQAGHFGQLRMRWWRWNSTAAADPATTTAVQNEYTAAGMPQWSAIQPIAIMGSMLPR